MKINACRTSGPRNTIMMYFYSKWMRSSKIFISKLLYHRTRSTASNKVKNTSTQTYVLHAQANRGRHHIVSPIQTIFTGGGPNINCMLLWYIYFANKQINNKAAFWLLTARVDNERQTALKSNILHYKRSRRQSYIYIRIYALTCCSSRANATS